MTKQKQNPSKKKQPRIVGFVCNWSAYSGVEMAGMKRMQYPTSLNLIRLMCLGQLHLGLMLKAFGLGADGVMLFSCPQGDCHYNSGTERARELVIQARKVLHLLGIDRERLALVEVPLGGGDVFTRRVSAFAKRINGTGSSHLRSTAKAASKPS